MSIYHHHSLALTDEEEAEFKKTGLGVKKIFMAMIKSLNTLKIDESIGDGENKSAIMLNIEEE